MPSLDGALAETIDYLSELFRRASHAIEPSKEGEIRFDIRLSDQELLDIPEHFERLRWRVKTIPADEVEHTITECSRAVSVIVELSTGCCGNATRSARPSTNEFRRARERFQKVVSALHRLYVVESGQERRESKLVHKDPLSERATMIYEKLRSLESHQAMTLPKIQKWYEAKTGKNLDEGTWKKIRKELLLYGLMNRPKAGYYVRCNDK